MKSETAETTGGTRKGRPNDPDRRARIIEACLNVVAEVGVAGVSHRKIAEVAGVPLGSMTYHFAGMDELLREAFTCFATRVSDQFEMRMVAAKDIESARLAVVSIILEDVFGSQRDLVLSLELYTLAARDPIFRDITTGWMKRSRAALELHFKPDTARSLDGLIEGITIHLALDSDPRDPSEIVQAVDRITASG